MLSAALPPMPAVGLLAAAGESDDPVPSDSPTVDVSLEAVTQTTISLLTLAVHAGVGALIGLAVAFVVLVTLRLLGRRRGLYAELARFCHRAAYVFGAMTGAYLGVQVALTSMSNSVTSTVVSRLLLIASIMAGTWLVVGMVRAVEASVVSGVRASGDEGRTSRVTTQSQIMRRVAQVVLIVCGLVGVVMTFPSARVAMGSLLASAGLVSVIAGLAAQSTLGNVFAGIQLATSDAIRVDDVVVVDDEQGTIEEITLTYVVVHTWDDRRLVLPSTYFTQNPFANWSRRGTQTTGTLTIDLDWRVPVSAVRAELARIVASSPAWDGRQASLDVIDASGGSVTLRIALSGANPSDVWALKCYVNEELVAWFQKQASYALPRTRVEVDQVEVAQDPAPEQVARLAEELAALQVGNASGQAAAQPTPGSARAEGLEEGYDAAAVTAQIAATSDPIEAARLRAAARGLSPLRRIRRERARRRSLLRRDPQEQAAPEPQAARPGRQEPTTVFPTTEMETLAESGGSAGRPGDRPADGSAEEATGRQTGGPAGEPVSRPPRQAAVSDPSGAPATPGTSAGGPAGQGGRRQPGGSS
ncbi:mechanosensitive ion channel family protein [Actinomyces sp. 2119]|uniref:Mechanosensitive ion channel family protein n=1 Tax=Actinomyces lilanjuaniae TaxID=2321394 RepID=A0ABM6Z1I4_9ACTO|nr:MULTISPECIES: mechanosensitive ion channel domain-containing protein [Actinomyces]AYD89147.1 mechanosensitive ion channel family protein [Actinomyces lilanjuaniae]RJF41928.1 mechanosensitive ion channel family protein [Actinomyces sp. 2119]